MASPLSTPAESVKATKTAAAGPRSGAKQGSITPVHKHWQVIAREERGFIYIPRSDWVDGLGKEQTARFFVSSFSKCVIVPPRFTYPHLTISLSDTLTLDKHVPHHVAIRSDSLHLSDSADAVRQVFYKKGLHTFVTRASVSSEALTKAQRWIKNAGLPYILKSLAPAPAVCSPVSDIMPVISEPFLTHAEITADMTDGSESDDEFQETEPPISETTLAEDKPTRSVASTKAAKQSGRPRGKGGNGKKSKKGRGKTSKRPEASPVVTPVAVSQPEEQKHYIQEWERRLGTDNLHELLEKLPVGDLTKVDESKCQKAFSQINQEFLDYMTKARNQREHLGYLQRAAEMFEKRFIGSGSNVCFCMNINPKFYLVYQQTNDNIMHFFKL